MASYRVLARKWRPQRFEEVVGQDQVVRTLVNAIETGRIAQAYLFVGPRGIGKTSIARIFAKALNCVEGPTAKPCGKCDSCLRIAEGTDIDVQEIDGASHTHAEQMRDLVDAVKYTAMRSRYKIYLIDEVHLLSQHAFTALLKTLEEPPSHVKFLFATTDPQKVLPTIISRCQRFDLRRIPPHLIVERLAAIAEAERIRVERDALVAIARGVDGALRDAESALDQLISFKGDHITEDDVLAVFGLVGRAVLENLAEQILKGDVPAILRIIASACEAGKDIQRLLVELVGYFRDILACLAGGAAAREFGLMDDQLEALRRHAELVDIERVLRVARILIETEERLRYALSKRAVLEVALVRCARAAGAASLEKLIADVEWLKRQMGGCGGEATPEPAAEVRGGRVEALRESKPAGAEAMSRECRDLTALRSKWASVARACEKLAVGTEHILADSRPVSVSGDKVVVAFDREFADEADNFRQMRRQKALQAAVSEALGREVAVELIVADNPAGRRSSVRKEEAGDTGAHRGMADNHGDNKNADSSSASTGRPERHSGQASRGGCKYAIANDPMVVKAMEVFEGRIVEIRR